jgi:hypothetical protein
MLTLATPAAGLSAADAAAQTQAQLVALGQSLQSLNSQILFAGDLAYNGVAVNAPANQLDRLRKLPGVTHIAIIPPKLPAGRASGAGARIPAVTAAIADATGAGVRIGIVDRGVDYTHADFGGTGSPANYTSNDSTLIEPGSFPTAKVSGGFDFAGDNYDASGVNGSPFAAPDPDPLECNQPLIGGQPNPANGEGTHIAGLAAGFGVQADGTTYHGPYDPGTDYSALKVVPGVAPEAQIYALKIFGCAGSSTLLTAAIGRAIDPNGDGNSSDHLDVLVISLGTPFGGADDPDAIAVDNAVRAGIVVVVAAGDSINTFYSINSPASSQLAIAVGAAGAAGQPVAASSARGPLRGNSVLKPDLIAPGVGLSSAAVASGAGAQSMSGTAIAATQVAGAAALLRQIHADWTPSEIKAALMNSATPTAAPPSLAGAGLLNVAGLESAKVLAFTGASNTGGVSFGAPWVAATSTTTRTVQLQNVGDTDQLITLSSTAVATETGVTVQLPASPINVPAHGTAQAVVGVSIDPAQLDFTRDNATPGVQGSSGRHYLAEHGGYLQVKALGSVSGTRIRLAHAAQIGSLDVYIDDVVVKRSLDPQHIKRYFEITPGQHVIKLRREYTSSTSRVLLTATGNLLDGHDYTLAVFGRLGTLGVLPIDESVSSPPPAGQALIHFTNANLPEFQQNIGPVDFYVDGVLRAPRVNIGETTPYTTIAPGQHLVKVYRTGFSSTNSNALTTDGFVVAAGGAVTAITGLEQSDNDTTDRYEQSVITGVDEPRIATTVLASLPFQVFPTAASDARAAAPAPIPPTAQSFTVSIQNSDARNAGMAGNNGTPHTPLASAFELEASSSALPLLSPGLRAADIQYVGITSGYSLTQNLQPDTLLFFGLASYAPWSTPNEIQFSIYIDSDKDGRDDFVLTNVNSNARDGGPTTDAFLNALYPLHADGTLAPATRIADWGSFAAPISSTINLAPFNTSVMFETMLARDLAIPLNPDVPFGPKGPVPSSFCYHVETRARDANFFSDLVDRVPELASPPQAACGGRGGVLLYDIPGATLKPINSTSPVFGSALAARPIFVDVNGGQISGGVNGAAVTANGGAQLLILHHHNAPFPQAQVVNLTPQLVRQQPLAPQARNFLPLAMH